MTTIKIDIATASCGIIEFNLIADFGRAGGCGLDCGGSGAPGNGASQEPSVAGTLS